MVSPATRSPRPDRTPVRPPPWIALWRAWRAAAGVLPSPQATPLTCAYLSTLGLTEWFMQMLGEPTLRHVAAAVSTDVAHLRTDPLTVLAGSALVPDQSWVSCAALFCVSLAPLERRIGSARTAAVFVAGHVIATLATEAPLGLAVAMGWLPHAAEHRLDYGVSYGMYACAGALTVLLPARWRRRALTGAATSTVVAAALDTRDLVGCAGHPVALAVGVACGHVLRRRRGHFSDEDGLERRR